MEIIKAEEKTYFEVTIVYQGDEVDIGMGDIETLTVSYKRYPNGDWYIIDDCSDMALTNEASKKLEILFQKSLTTLKG